MYTQNELSEWSKCVHEYTDEEVNTWVRSQIDEMEEFAKGTGTWEAESSRQKLKIIKTLTTDELLSVARLNLSNIKKHPKYFYQLPENKTV